MSAQPALVQNEKKLLEKINILCLMEIIFRYIKRIIALETDLRELKGKIQKIPLNITSAVENPFKLLLCARKPLLISCIARIPHVFAKKETIEVSL